MVARVPIQQDRTLFNPKFEGYKLSFLEESRQQFTPVGAPGPGINVPKLPSSAKLSYREVQARVRHNHLHPGWNTLRAHNGDSSTSKEGLLFAIDDDFMLVGMHFDKSTRRLRSKRLLQIPAPVVPLNFHLEFPSVKPLSADHLFVSDGASTFYLIRVFTSGPDYSAEIEAYTTFQANDAQSSSEGTTPCGLLEAKAFPIIKDDNSTALEIKFIVHYTFKETFFSSEPSPHHKSDTKTIFIVSLCSMVWDRQQLNSASTDTDMDVDKEKGRPHKLPMTVVHALRGTEIPFYCALDPSNEGYILGSNSAYKPTKEPVVDQTTRYLEPGSAAMELDGTDVGVTPSAEPPYIWTQTESDLTICFALPKGTTKHAVQCRFTVQGLQLQVNLSQPADQAVRAANFDNMPLFDKIRPDECLWTLESSTGVLTLNLEKQHSKTRWTQVFAEGVDTDPVEETLDPSVFAEYKSALEKYTTDQANAGPQGSSLLPAIAQDAQEDIDAEGEEIKFSWIQSEDGLDIVRASTVGTGHDWIGQAFPSFEPQGENPFRAPTICLKHDVDGLVYAIQHVPGTVPSLSTISRSDGIMKFVHVSTFDALAFVQASKREKRFVMHDPHFRFSAIVESSRNVYIYWHTPDAKLQQERQTVVDVSKGRQVDIIGCQLIADGVLVILMEGQDGALVLDLNQA